jgi:hypothetical protein
MNFNDYSIILKIYNSVVVGDSPGSGIVFWKIPTLTAICLYVVVVL